MTQVAQQESQGHAVMVTLRRVNPFIAQAMIHLKEDGHVPASIQQDLLAWENGTLPSQQPLSPPR